MYHDELYHLIYLWCYFYLRDTGAEVIGLSVGAWDGASEATLVGDKLGWSVAAGTNIVGALVLIVGDSEGASVGDSDGNAVGEPVGVPVPPVGEYDGEYDGTVVGE